MPSILIAARSRKISRLSTSKCPDASCPYSRSSNRRCRLSQEYLRILNGATVLHEGARLASSHSACGRPTLSRFPAPATHQRGEQRDRVAARPDDRHTWEATVEARPGDRYYYVVDGRQVPDPVSRLLAGRCSRPDGDRRSSGISSGPIPAGAACRFPTTCIYELHLGTFTPEGTFDGAIEKLDYLKQLGVTAIELMPVNAFPGRRNWGYDGVGLYAVQASYGGPEAFRRFVDEAHRRGLAVVLDVVYNHLGNEGNYLRLFGPYFTARHQTPWGDARQLRRQG